MDVVYHFSDTVRLPWIIDSGELRPGLNRIGGFPLDFLWATTSAAGPFCRGFVIGEQAYCATREVAPTQGGATAYGELFRAAVTNSGMAA